MLYVIQKDGRSEHSYDIYSRLLKDRIVFIGSEHPQLEGITNYNANLVIAQILFLMSDNKNQDINIYINSPGGRDERKTACAAELACHDPPALGRDDGNRLRHRHPVGGTQTP